MRTVSAMLLLRTYFDISSESSALAPPITKRQGFSGFSKALLSDFSSLSIMRPAALFNMAVKPTTET